MNVTEENYKNLNSIENDIKEYKPNRPSPFSFKEFVEEGTVVTVSQDEMAAEEEEEEFNLCHESRQLVDYLNPPCLAQLHNEVAESFDKLRETMVPILDNKIHKKVIQVGQGDPVTQTSFVTIHYNAYLELQDEPFDSSRLRSLPQKFVVGKGKILSGLEACVMSMKVGEISIFVVHPDYAYGTMGVPPRIPPCSEILYEVELLSALDNATEALEFEQLSWREKSQLPFSKIHSVCTFENQLGNELIKRKDYRMALPHYQRAIHYLQSLGLLPEEEEEKSRSELLFKLYLNSSLCRLKLNDTSKAILCARKALEINSRSAKAMFRYAKALQLKHCLEDARKMLQKASAIEPYNQEIIKAILEINQIQQRNALQEKQYCRRMFGNKNGVKAAAANQHGLEDKAVKKLREILQRFAEMKRIKSLPLSSSYSSLELTTIKRIAKEYDMALVEPSSEHTSYMLVKDSC